MSPKVSVILPAYNHARYVHAAVDSVLKQSMPDFELIAIDDCSTDETHEVLKGIDDPRVTVLRHETNRGSADTINAGVAMAKAPVIAILNSDDWFHPKRLAYSIQALQSKKCLLLGSDVELIDSQGVVVDSSTHWWRVWHDGLKNIWKSSGDLVTSLIHGNIYVSTSNFVFKRDVIDDVGLFSSYRYVQDYEYLLRLLRRHPEGLEMLDNPLLCYRLHDANTILEDRVGPALQTLQILSRHATPLLVGPNSVQRQLGYEEHLLRLAEYIEHGSAEKANARWVNRIETMQKCIDDLDLYSKRISEHNASLQLFCDRQQVELEKAHAHGEELQRWGEGLQAHADTLQAENTSLHAHVQELQRWGEDLQAHADTLQAEISSLHAHVDNLQRWGDDLQAYSSAVEANNHGLQTTVEDCLQWGNELQAFCDKALIDNQGLQDHIETLQKWGDDLSAYCEALQDENRRLHIRVKELQH